jgi:CheY-like chemotaxis protein
MAGVPRKTGDFADAKERRPRHSRGMHREPTDSRRLRVLLVDDHETPRAACRALLRIEGLEVVADVPVGERALAATAAFDPDVVVIDIGLGDERALALADRLRAAARATCVLLTSAAGRARLGPVVAGFRFVEKADICAERLAVRAA